MKLSLNEKSIALLALAFAAGTAFAGEGHGATPAAPAKPAMSEPAKVSEPVKVVRMGEAPKSAAPEGDDSPSAKTAAKPAMKPAAQVEAKPMPASPRASGAAPEPAAGPTADQALAWLKEGNERFAQQHVQNPNCGSERITETAAGQHPFASILSCADSRVPVERVFDRGVGDLFVVRVAGNVAGESETGTLEYGTGHLKTPLLVVMGHTSCGAVNAAASGAELHGAVAKLVGRIQPSVDQARAQYPELKADQIVPIAIRLNVMQTIESLMTQSDEIGGLVRSGKLEIVGAVYDINTGAVQFLGEHPRQTALLKQGRAAQNAQAEGSEPEGH